MDGTVIGKTSVSNLNDMFISVKTVGSRVRANTRISFKSGVHACVATVMYNMVTLWQH